MLPELILLIPKHARPIADFPDPASPASPTTSPALTLIDTSFKKLSGMLRFFTFNSVLPGWLFISGKKFLIVRPVASSINFC